MCILITMIIIHAAYNSSSACCPCTIIILVYLAHARAVRGAAFCCCHGNRYIFQIKHTTIMEDEKGSSRAPACIDWSVEEVADWIERLGYKEYRVNNVCIRSSSPNNIIKMCWYRCVRQHDLYTPWAVLRTYFAMAINRASHL